MVLRSRTQGAGPGTGAYRVAGVADPRVRRGAATPGPGDAARQGKRRAHPAPPGEQAAQALRPGPDPHRTGAASGAAGAAPGRTGAAPGAAGAFGTRPQDWHRDGG